MISQAVTIVLPFLRPVAIVMCGVLMIHFPTTIYKAGLTLQGMLYLLLCNDKSWKKPKDPSITFDPLLQSNETTKIERKTLYFVRHGESTWNDTFNKGQHRSTLVFVVGFIPGLIKSVMYELYLLFTGRMDSWFYDAPLSYLGLGQVEQLKTFLEKVPAIQAEGKMVAILRADRGAPKSKIVCSALRRALSTMAGGFQRRLEQNPWEQITVLPSLQEISRNPDTLAIMPAHTLVTASWIDKTSSLCDFQRLFSKQVDMSLHTGNKPIGTNGLIRMKAFCEFVFSQREEHIIVGGHSIYFRAFFKTFLPYGEDHVAKTKKIINCGVVALDLLQVKNEHGKVYHMIDPKSIQVVYGGF